MKTHYIKKYDLICYKVNTGGPDITKYARRENSALFILLYDGEDYVSSDGKIHLTFDDAFKHVWRRLSFI